MPAPLKPGYKTTEHWLTVAALILAAAIIISSPWWWQKIAALTPAAAAAGVYAKSRARLKAVNIGTAAIEAAIDSVTTAITVPPAHAGSATAPPGMTPYIDPVRGSSRTGQLVYQFVAAELPRLDAPQLRLGTNMDTFTKFIADIVAKALKTTKPETTTALEAAASATAAAGLAIYAAITAVKADATPATTVTAAK